MSRYSENNQGADKMKNPANVWASIKPKSVVDQLTGEVRPPHIRVSYGDKFALTPTVDFMSGSHVYRVEGSTPDKKDVKSAFFSDFSKPFKVYLPGAPLLTYRELQKDPAWKLNKMKLVRYTWGILRYIDTESGEANSVTCMLALTNSFEDFDNGDLGTLRKLTAGAGDLVKFDAGEFRKLKIEPADPVSDPETEKLFESSQSEFVKYFRQSIPGYLSEYFDADGNPTRFDGK